MEPTDEAIDAYRSELRSVPVLLLYHLVSDHDVVHVKHLFRYKKEKQFAADLDFVLKHYTPVDIKALIDHVQHGTPLPPNPCSISFDDGLRESYEIAAPLLKQRGIPATFFLNSSFLDNKDLFWRHKASLLVEHFAKATSEQTIATAARIFRAHELAYSTFAPSVLSIPYAQRHVIDELGAQLGLDFAAYLATTRPYLATREVESMIEDGFHFGAHTIDHPRFEKLTLREQVAQTVESTDFVRKRFNLDYAAFAFPFSDIGVSNAYFEHPLRKSSVQISFGTAGLIEDVRRDNLQRITADTLDLETALVREYEQKTSRRRRHADVMRRPDYDTRVYTIRDLRAALTSNALWTTRAIPITKHRARAHVENPRARPDDIALVATYHEDEPIGALSIVPDHFVIDAQVTRFGWMSAWYGSRDHRGAGKELMRIAYGAWKGHLAAANASDRAHRSAMSSGLYRDRITEGTRLFFGTPGRPPDEGLRRWRAEMRQIPGTSTELEYIGEIDPDTERFILRHRAGELSQRGKEELNWMLRYPWVLPALQNHTPRRSFFFSATSSIFYYSAVKIFEGEDLIAFMILRNRDGNYLVPYLSCEPRHMALAARVLVAHLAAGAAQFATWNGELAASVTALAPEGTRTMVMPRKDYFSASAFSMESLSSLRWQDGDGDLAFT
jgi:peptidoglycan/xylan/chitin deacetylase (PgdA/CDA1 family)